MRSGINAFLSFPVFAILYCFTAVGVVIVFILTALKAKRAVQFITMHDMGKIGICNHGEKADNKGEEPP